MIKVVIAMIMLMVMAKAQEAPSKRIMPRCAEEEVKFYGQK
jgi:hypothetical protein